MQLKGQASCLSCSFHGAANIVWTPDLCTAADEFPCFFSRNSGCKAPTTIESAAEAAELMRSSQLLAMGSSILIGESLVYVACVPS